MCTYKGMYISLICSLSFSRPRSLSDSRAGARRAVAFSQPQLYSRRRGSKVLSTSRPTPKERKALVSAEVTLGLTPLLWLLGFT